MVVKGRIVPVFDRRRGKACPLIQLARLHRSGSIQQDKVVLDTEKTDLPSYFIEKVRCGRIEEKVFGEVEVAQIRTVFLIVSNVKVTTVVNFLL